MVREIGIVHLAQEIQGHSGMLSYRSEPEVEEAGARLVQHVILKAADKAEYRSLAAVTALRLAQALPEQRQMTLLTLVSRMAHCPKVRMHIAL